jgi:NADH-quinone oxidoreductase subunit E
MVQIGADTYEDLTPELLETVLNAFAKGTVPPPGSQIGRTASCPEGGPTTLSDPSLYDGSRNGEVPGAFRRVGDVGWTAGECSQRSL